MNEPDLNGADNGHTDVENYLKRFRPVETSASIAETFYQAGWLAAVALNKSSGKKSARRTWTTFLCGAACGLLPMLILLTNGQAGSEAGVSKSDVASAPLVQHRDEAANHVEVATSGDADGSVRTSPIEARTPSAINVFAESLMLQSWFPRLQIGESLMTSNSTSVLRFRPLTNAAMDLANIDQGASPSSNFPTTANDAILSVDSREPLSARSSALSADLLRELFL